VKNLGILSVILNHKPKSIYELAKLIPMDVSNLNKLIVFFENVGAIKIKISHVDGRAVKTPLVEYDQVEFDLKSA
jgi:predicted transcriptional regulator